MTGSNSKFLSSDIATEFKGRGTEIHVLPLSFEEYRSGLDLPPQEAWREYIETGGMIIIRRRRAKQPAERHEKSGYSEKVSDSAGFSVCMHVHVIVSNRHTRFPLPRQIDTSTRCTQAAGCFLVQPGYDAIWMLLESTVQKSFRSMLLHTLFPKASQHAVFQKTYPYS